MKSIVSGEEFLKNKEKYQITGKVIPFNEAMVDGNPAETIFSPDFIEERCKTHNITVFDYEKITMAHVRAIGREEEIHLYFGFDMFCQINLLTLLAYLEQIDYRKEITVFICDEINDKVIDVFKTTAGDYSEAYKSIVVEKKQTATPNKYLNEAEELYFNYAKKDAAVLKSLLSGCVVRGEKEQIAYLIRHNAAYGLGDTQWAKWLSNL